MSEHDGKWLGAESTTFITEYVVDGEVRSGKIEASDREMAQLGCDMRCPGERVVARVIRRHCTPDCERCAAERS